MVTILCIALSLALDAFAVSVSSGISVPGFSWRDALKLGLWCGAFQFFMPLVGFALGSSVSGYISAVDHWIAFLLLFVIGGHMVWGAVKKTAGEEDAPVTELTVRRLFLLAFATSIDALAVGVSMAFMSVNIWVASGVIGGVAFVLALVGGLAGRRLGALFQRRAELVGGLVLVAIGVKILVEHTMG